jgi:cytochrome bd ubiquinol oxidase subunit II
MSILAIIWFCLAPVLLTIYCVTDGFDLGVGAIYGLIKDPNDKKKALFSILPVWNGNEVWLIGSVGVLLAAFPPVYGTLLSAMYVPVYLVIFSIILRGVSIEYLAKVSTPGLQKILTGTFIFGSAFILFAIGFVGGNVLYGLPVNGQGIMQKNFLYLFNPVAIAAGLTSLVFFVGHGAIYLALRGEGQFRESMKQFFSRSWKVTVGLMIVSVLCGFVFIPEAFGFLMSKPLTLVLIVLSVVLYVITYLKNQSGAHGLSFIFSALTTATLIISGATVMFPNILRSNISKDFNLTVMNSAVSDKSLLINLIIVLLALPFILGFVIWIYRIFRKDYAKNN